MSEPRTPSASLLNDLGELLLLVVGPKRFGKKADPNEPAFRDARREIKIEISAGEPDDSPVWWMVQTDDGYNGYNASGGTPEEAVGRLVQKLEENGLEKAERNRTRALSELQKVERQVSGLRSRMRERREQ